MCRTSEVDLQREPLLEGNSPKGPSRSALGMSIVHVLTGIVSVVVGIFFVVDKADCEEFLDVMMGIVSIVFGCLYCISGTLGVAKIWFESHHVVRGIQVMDYISTLAFFCWKVVLVIHISLSHALHWNKNKC